MSYGRVDDRMPWRPKVRNVSWACRGVIGTAALPYCSGGETDGILHPDFERDLIFGRDGRRAFREAIERGFIHRAGELCAKCLEKLREADAEPPTIGHYLHDYLEHNPSKKVINQRRTDAAERQAKRRAEAAQTVLPWAEPSVSRVTHAPEVTGVEGGSTESNEEQRYSRAQAPGVVGEVMTILRRCSRLSVPDHCEPAIESAIAGAPGKDPVAAAHTAVTWASDPAWRKTWGPSVLGDALRKQEPGVKAKGDQSVLRSERTCARCKVAKVPPGYGAYCEKCSEELAA